MSTIADWDAAIRTQIDSTVNSILSPTSVSSMANDTTRETRMESDVFMYQIRHAQQGVDSSINSAQSYAVVQTQMDLYYRHAGSERVYTLTKMHPIQAVLTLRSTWEALASCHSVIEGPVCSPPSSSPGSNIVVFSIELAILLAP